MTTVAQTARPRPGRRFQPTHELALDGAALAACASLPGAHRGVVVVREMTGPIGIPDLTALVGDRSALDLRLTSGVEPLLNQADAAIVAVLNTHRSRTVRGIAKALGWPQATVERRIPTLVQRGALLPVSASSYVRRPELRPLGRLFAVEAKVRDRGAALQQARTYRVWADGYVIVMGALGAGPLEAIRREVDKDRGGLVVDEQWLRRPTVRVLDAARRLWAAEHFVAALAGA